MAWPKQLRFLKSALTPDSDLCSCKELMEWLQQRNEAVKVKVERIRLSEMNDWYLDQDKGRIRHRSGKFFSIDGIRVCSNAGNVHEWEQPIINQPEIGFLGLITKEIGGVLHFLVQAKIEPGNINHVQLSPTLQATKSNFTCVHHGRKPLYLDYFIESGRAEVLLDQLQSEQGARFLHKRNRNIIVEVHGQIECLEDFRWATLGQIKSLMRYDNLVNMDLRTVISGIHYGTGNCDELDLLEYLSDVPSPFVRGMLTSALDGKRGHSSFDEIISWFTERKMLSELSLEMRNLCHLKDWEISDDCLHHTRNLYFDVLWVNVEISNREVACWQQPLVAPKEEGILAFICKRIDGVYHFLVQAKLECGNFDTLEFAPTVQCITGSYRHSLETLPYLKYVLTAPPGQVRFDSMQSEEGGRFYHEQNRNLIIEAEDDFPEDCPPNFHWMTLHQLLSFIRFNNYLNIQARSLLASIALTGD